ncbi:MAG: hypothetical protein ABI577_02865 [bacterium]
MSPAQMIRWSGLALALGGICFMLFLIVHPYGEVAGAHVAHNSAWKPAHSFHFFGAMFTLFGLVGLYAWRWEPLGKLGFAAFVLAFIGTAMFVGTGMITAALWPAIAKDYPPFVAKDGGMFEDPLVAGTTTATYVFLSLGYVLLGAVLWRKQLAPVGACALLMVGILMFSAPVDPVGPAPWIARYLGAIVFGAALAWLGYLQWRSNPAPALIGGRDYFNDDR